MRSILFVLVVIVLFGSCSENDWRTKAENPEFIHRSVKQVTDVIVHDIFSPPVASRIYAYMSVAGYECAIHQSPEKYQTLAGQLNGLEPVPQPVEGEEYCYSLASVQAMLKIGRALVFSDDRMTEYYEGIMQEFKDTGMPEDVFQRSVDYGNQVGEHIMTWSSKDKYKQSRSYPKYSLEDNPATWQPTPPAYMDAVEPHWNKIRTFVLDSASQFRPVGPTPFSIDKTSQFYKEAMEVRDMGAGLTEQQREIASFWDCNPFVMNVSGHLMFATKKISPGGHWMNITHVACKKTNADFVKSTEAYVRVSLSLVDGFISCWDEKFRSKVIRPETYINKYIDDKWTPLLQTPPFPEYTSGHSVISGASSVALTGVFGDNFAFTDSTEIEFGLTARNFNSFKEAAKEAGISRMYGGIHYRPAMENGLKQGFAIGEFIQANVITRKEEATAAK
jgi:hypothetical protein